MSDTFFRYVPVDRHFQPTQANADAASAYLASVLQTFVTQTFHDDIIFIDAGENWDGVSCPICGTDLEVEWWSDSMSEAHNSHFALLDVVVPCCGAQTSLDKLRYSFPVAFGRFELEADNPNCYTLTESPEQFAQLEKLLGCDLQEVIARI